MTRFLDIIIAWHAAASVVAFLAYGHDKSCARRGERRVPESTLHWMALAGGWPGAWLAQGVFRHKSKKSSFRIIFVLTVLGHLALTGAVWLACLGD